MTKPTFAFPVREGANTAATSIELEWNLISQAFHTGGTPILAYDIYWD